MKKFFSLISIIFISFIGFTQNNAPLASNVSVATVKNTNAKIHLVASDPDFDSLTYAIVSDSSNGTFILIGNTVTYTPKSDFTDTDFFTFKANDGTSDSKTKIFTVTGFSRYQFTATQIGLDIDGEAAGDNSENFLIKNQKQNKSYESDLAVQYQINSVDLLNTKVLDSNAINPEIDIIIRPYRNKIKKLEKKIGKKYTERH